MLIQGSQISFELEDSFGLCCSQTAEAVGGLRGALVRACSPCALSSALLPCAREFVYLRHTPQQGMDVLNSPCISFGLIKPLFFILCLAVQTSGWLMGARTCVLEAELCL